MESIEKLRMNYLLFRFNWTYCLIDENNICRSIIRPDSYSMIKISSPLQHVLKISVHYDTAYTFISYIRHCTHTHTVNWVLLYQYIWMIRKLIFLLYHDTYLTEPLSILRWVDPFTFTDCLTFWMSSLKEICTRN